MPRKLEDMEYLPNYFAPLSMEEPPTFVVILR